MTKNSSGKTFFEPYLSAFIETILVQEIFYSQIKDDTTLKVRLINPTAGPVSAVGEYAKYVTFYFEALSVCVDPELEIGNFALIQFPLNAWGKAMRQVPLSRKKHLRTLGDDDLIIEFYKKNKNNIRILSISPSPCNTEDKMKALKHYNEQKEETK